MRHAESELRQAHLKTVRLSDDIRPEIAGLAHRYAKVMIAHNLGDLDQESVTLADDELQAVICEAGVSAEAV